MWDHLDEASSSGYQDSLVLHMIHKPIQVSFQKEEDRWVCGAGDPLPCSSLVKVT